MAVDWPNLVIGMLGGDKREQEIARRAGATGAEVRALGFPWPEHDIPGVQHLADPAAVLKGARFALFPIPGIAANGALFAPAATTPIIPDRAMLAGMAPHAHIILGWADKNLKAHCDALSIKLHEYEWDRSLMLQRTPAIVEGLLKIVIENSAITIHNSNAVVVGQGTIGAVLARYLVALGAHTHVAARNPEQRSAAYVAGATPHTLDELPALAPKLDFVFSTVPTRVVGEDVLAQLAEACADRRSRCATGRRGFRGRQAPRLEGDLGTRARQPRAGHGRRQPMGRHSRADRENPAGRSLMENRTCPS